MLRSEFGFKGVVMSDDLDSRATLRNCSIEEVAIEALNAESDYSLLAAIGDQLERVISAICESVEKGGIPEKRLKEAGAKVRSLTGKYSD
jgi:beta-N-acetylhexosaminidase